MTTVWVNGSLVPEDAPVLGPLDHGLTVGDGVFESLKVTGGVPFAVTRHLARLARSAAVLELPLPGGDELRGAIDAVLAEAGPIDGKLRITVTGGTGPLGSGRAEHVAPTVVVAASASSPWPARIAAVTVPWTRNENSAVAGAKTTSYAENVVALRAAHRAGADEALLGNTAGQLCEGTGSNVWVVVDGVLVTPPLSSGCLAGVTRDLVLEWSAQEGLPVAEADVPMAWLPVATEVMLSSSTRDLQHVDVLDGRALVAGELGTAVAAMFARRAAAHPEP